MNTELLLLNQKETLSLPGYPQCNGRHLPEWSAATRPHTRASGRPPQGHPLQLSIPHPYFQTSQGSQEFSWSPGCSSNFGAAPSRPTGPVLGHPQDQRKSPELATDLSGFMDGGSNTLKQGPEAEMEGKGAGCKG